MALVPDASAIVGHAFADEDPTYAKAVIQTIVLAGGIVPVLFWFELRNTLLMGERRKCTTPERTSEFLSYIAILPLIVSEPPREATVSGLHADTHSLCTTRHTWSLLSGTTCRWRRSIAP